MPDQLERSVQSAIERGLKQPAKLPHEIYRVFGGFPQIARRAKELRVRPLVSATFFQGNYVVDMEVVAERFAASGASPSLGFVDFEDVTRGYSFARRQPASMRFQARCYPRFQFSSVVFLVGASLISPFRSRSLQAPPLGYFWKCLIALPVFSHIVLTMFSRALPRRGAFAGFLTLLRLSILFVAGKHYRSVLGIFLTSSFQTICSCTWDAFGSERVAPSWPRNMKLRNRLSLSARGALFRVRNGIEVRHMFSMLGASS
jgi:hypothetical protein